MTYPSISLTPLPFLFIFQAADHIKKICKASPYIPVITRWNSLFYAVRWILQRPRRIFQQLLTSLDLPTITTLQWKVLEEYVSVLTPIAEAITYLEGEKNMYLGHLLPVVNAVAVNLVKAKSTLKHLKPLAAHLIEQLKTKRFGAVLDSDHHKLAAYFHPERKLTWVTDELGKPDALLKNHARDLMVQTLEEMAEAGEYGSRQEREPEAANQVQDEEAGGSGGLFSVFSPASQMETDEFNEFNARDCVNMFLKSKRPKLSACDEHPLLKAAFIKFNTGLPSSAAAERLFSTGNDILRPKRSAMSDDNFDMAMFLRGNRDRKF